MRKIGLGIWLVFFLASLSVLGWKFSTSIPIDTNILALFPESHDQQSNVDWVHKVKEKFEKNTADKVVILLSHGDKDIVVEAAENLKAQLDAYDLLSPMKLSDDEAENNQGFLETIYPYRAGLLSDRDRALLQDGNYDVIVKQAMAQILSPFGLSNAESLKTDPFQLLPRYLAEKVLSANRFILEDGLLQQKLEEENFVLLTWELNGAAYSKTIQQKLIPFVDTTLSTFQANYSDVKVFKTGAVFYAGHAMEEAQNEATFIGGISLIAIILMLLLVFRHIQPIYLALLSITAGIAAGFAINLLVFGKVYIFTIVFGAAITGVAVDYAIHYCCTRFSDAKAGERIHLVQRALIFGAISSMIGFTILMWPPFPGLRQIGLFSAVGLFMSCLTVIVAFPYLDRTKPLSFPLWLRSLTKATDYFWYMRSLRIWRFGLYAIVALLAGWGGLTLQANDNLREMQSVSQSLKAEETVIRKIGGLDQDSQFFVVSADKTEIALQREEKLRGLLDDLIQMEALTSYHMMSNLIPSQKRQMENRSLLDARLLTNELDRFKQVIRYKGEIDYGLDTEGYLTADQLSFTQLDTFTLPVDQGVAHIVSLKNIQNLSAMSHIADQIDGVVFVDPAAEIGDILAEYRMQVIYLIVCAVFVIYIFLRFIYGWKKAFFVLLPPVLAVILTPLLLSVGGEVFTFFNAMALILVFALGVDYAVFCAETTGAHYLESLAANWLSALSSVFAFGLLAFSQQYAVHAFGVTILLGVLLAFFMAPLAREKG